MRRWGGHVVVGERDEREKAQVVRQKRGRRAGSATHVVAETVAVAAVRAVRGGDAEHGDGDES